MEPLDLGPATTTLQQLVRETPDDALGAPTPCPAYTAADLIDHIGGLALAFTWAAQKRDVPELDAAPAPDGRNLGPGWRERITRDLDALAEAWRKPSAYEGMTRAGGVDLPGEVAGLVALNEVVVHGWDLAMATGQRYDADEALVGVCLEFLGPAEDAEDAEDDGGLFGPPVPVDEGAPPLDRLVGRAGRRPDWTAPVSPR